MNESIRSKLPTAAAAASFATAALIASLLLAGVSTGHPPSAAAQTAPSVGLDVDPEGNSGSAAANIDSCISVEPGEAFDVDVYVKDVRNLLAWEVYFRYDQSRLEILRADVRLFLRNQAGSNVVSVSDPLPNRTGLYRIAAADIASPAALESGSGVLTRVTLEAKKSGTTAISLPHLDFNGDAEYDLGPKLIGRSGVDIGDTDGDRLLDGEIDSARVVVDSSCAAAPEVSPTPYVFSESTGPDGSPDPDSPASGSASDPDGGSSPSDGNNPNDDGSGGGGNDGGTSAGGGSDKPEGTPEGDSPPGVNSSDGGGGSSSILTLILATVGGAGILGLLLVLAALRQSGRRINL